MFDIFSVTLLTSLAVGLNIFAARIADRSSNRRARLETNWKRMIVGVMSETTGSRKD